MKQKAVLAGALIHEPKLLMLDEPLTGLDAAASRLVKDLIRERVAQGAGVILTTHILEVAERMADRIGIIKDGKLLIEGSLEELRNAGRRAGAVAGGRVPVADGDACGAAPNRASAMSKPERSAG